MADWDDLLVDGTGLSTLAHIEDFSGIQAGPPTDQEFITIPGRQGVVFVPGEWAAYSFPVPMVVLGATLGEVNQNLDSLTALLDSREEPLELTRRLTVGDGEYGGVQTAGTCNGAVVGGWAPQYIGTGGIRVVVTFMNLDGAWTPVAGS